MLALSSLYYVYKISYQINFDKMKIWRLKKFFRGAKKIFSKKINNKLNCNNSWIERQFYIENILIYMIFLLHSKKYKHYYQCYMSNPILSILDYIDKFHTHKRLGQHKQDQDSDHTIRYHIHNIFQIFSSDHSKVHRKYKI